MFFAPVDCNLPQCLRAKREPGRLDAVPPNGALEIPECPGAMDGVQKILANPVGLHRARGFLHDPPFVNIELRGKLARVAGEENSLCSLPFLFLPRGKIRFLVVAALLRRAQQIAGDGFHLARVEIQERGGLVELHLQSVDDVAQANSRGHGFGTIIQTTG